jgi:hypothetical protein
VKFQVKICKSQFKKSEWDVGLYIPEDPESFWHWRKLSATRLVTAHEKAQPLIVELKREAAARLQVRAAKDTALARELLGIEKPLDPSSP